MNWPKFTNGKETLYVRAGASARKIRQEELSDFLRENFREYWELYWKDRPKQEPEPEPKPKAKPKRDIVFKENPPVAERFVSWVPVIPIKAAAGVFSEDQDAGVAMVEHAETWVNPGRPVDKGSFALRVVGHSMEPTIQDGDLCLFGPVTGGSKKAQVVLAQLHNGTDSETGGRYTVKIYSSVKGEDENGNPVITKVELSPKNPDYKVLSFEPDDPEIPKILAIFRGRIS